MADAAGAVGPVLLLRELLRVLVVVLVVVVVVVGFLPELVQDAALGQGQGAAVLADVQGFGGTDEGVVVDGFVGGDADDGVVFSFVGGGWDGHCFSFGVGAWGF